MMAATGFPADTRVGFLRKTWVNTWPRRLWYRAYSSRGGFGFGVGRRRRVRKTAAGVEGDLGGQDGGQGGGRQERPRGDALVEYAVAAVVVVKRGYRRSADCPCRAAPYCGIRRTAFFVSLRFDGFMKELTGMRADRVITCGTCFPCCEHSQQRELAVGTTQRRTDAGTGSEVAQDVIRDLFLDGGKSSGLSPSSSAMGEASI